MAERFLAAAREASVEPTLDFLGAHDVAGSVRLEQRRGGRYGEDVDKAAGGTEHQAAQQCAKGIEDLNPGADLVVKLLEMLKVGEDFLHRDHARNRCQTRRELRR